MKPVLKRFLTMRTRLPNSLILIFKCTGFFLEICHLIAFKNNANKIYFDKHCKLKKKNSELFGWKFKSLSYLNVPPTFLK